MTTILGIDISAGRLTGHLLSELPTIEWKTYTQSKDFTIIDFPINRENLQKISSLEFDAIAIEPSGYHAEQVLLKWCNENNIEVLLCSGFRVRSLAKMKGLPKTDSIDSFTIAAYALQHYGQPTAFVIPCVLTNMRQKWLCRKSLYKISSSLINRLRGRLLSEFPEREKIVLTRLWGKEIRPFLYWLAQVNRYNCKSFTTYSAEHDGGKKQIKGKIETIPATIGLSLSEETRFIAKLCIDVQEKLLELEQAIDTELARPELKPYVQAMDKLGFSQQLKSAWLPKIYPFQRFLLPDGSPNVVTRPNRMGKMTSYNLSLSQFKACLGAGTIEDTSGIRQKTRRRQRQWHDTRKQQPTEYTIGDKHCRSAFFLWALAKIEGASGKGISDEFEYQAQLIAKRNELKDKGKKVYQRIGNLHGYTARILYRELRRELK